MSMQKDRESIKQDLAEYYDHTAHEYHESNYHGKGHYAPLQYRQQYIEKMIEAQQLPLGARVIDVGCGPGGLTLSLLKKGYLVWAVDISQTMADETVKNVNANGYPEWWQVKVGDIESLEFSDGFFDVVVAAGVIEYQRDDEPSLNEMRRVLKKDQYMILNVTNRYSPMRILNKPYSWLKNQSLSKGILNLLKQRILGRGQLTGIPVSRTHSPRNFDRKMSEAGFEKISHNYFGFSPLPAPFCPLFGHICGRVGNWMENLTRSPFGFLGGGYIVIAKKSR